MSGKSFSEKIEVHSTKINAPESSSSPGFPDLTSILNKSVKGSIALKYYNENKSLEEKHRTYIVHAIVDRLRLLQLIPKHADFKYYAHQICNIFESEDKVGMNFTIQKQKNIVCIYVYIL